MGLCLSKRQESDDKDEQPTAVQSQNADSISQLNGFPLPNELVEHVASFLGGDHGSFADRVGAAAVCRQLRKAVIGSMHRMKERFLVTRVNYDHISVMGIRVNNDRPKIIKPPPSIDQMECVRTLTAFGQPTQLVLTNVECVRFVSPIASIWPKLLMSNDVVRYDRSPYNCYLLYPLQQEERRMTDVHRIISSVSPLSITRLRIRLHIGQFIDKTPFNDIMKVIGGMSNLQTLRFICRCEETPESLAHHDSLPSVSEKSPFNHLLKLERLRGLRITAPELVSPKQQADLINRSPSTINHLCCMLFTVAENETMLVSMNAVARANITSACCWGVHPEMPLVLLMHLPNCRSISRVCRSVDPFPTKQDIEEMVGYLLTDCHDNDDRRGKTLELKIELMPNKLQEYLESGGQTELSRNREQSVVSVTVGAWSFIGDVDCPLRMTMRYYL